MKWFSGQPRPHRQYFVKRETMIFTATPCYGMHAPWWVPRVPRDRGGHAESEPVNMLSTDLWRPAPEVPYLQWESCGRCDNRYRCYEEGKACSEEGGT